MLSNAKLRVWFRCDRCLKIQERHYNTRRCDNCCKPGLKVVAKVYQKEYVNIKVTGSI